jgi:hypothetical protein
MAELKGEIRTGGLQECRITNHPLGPSSKLRLLGLPMLLS